MEKKSNLLSIILLSYYSKERINTCYYDIKKLLDNENIPFEFIVMDDGSNDNSYDIALELEKRKDNVKAFQLSRNFTSHYSVFAGLTVCNGTCAIPMVDDEQQPYETIVKMYRLWESGSKIIIPHRITRDDAWIDKFFSNLFYKIMNKLSIINYPEGGADTFFIDREIIDIINKQIHPINTASITEVLRLGFSPTYLPYKRPLGINEKSRWSFKKKIRLAKDMFFSSSNFPIKLISNLGLIFSILSVILIVFYIYIKILGNNEFWKLNIPGWTSIILAISFFGGLTLLSLGVIAEYIWRIYEEVKNRPGYIIKNKE